MSIVKPSDESKREVIERTAAAIAHFLNSIKGVEIIKLLNKKIKGEKRNKPFMYDEKFSKYRNPFRNNNYRDVSTRTALKILSVLEPSILEEHKWDRANKRYIAKDKYIFDEEAANLRMQGLDGLWIGYTWDRATSIRSKGSYVHIFKVEIDAASRIVCTTEHDVFISQKKILIDNKVVAGLINEALVRMIILVIPLGLSRELQKINTLYTTYTDTGDRNPTAGLAILERTSQEHFKELNPRSVEASSITNVDYLDFLQDSQHIVDREKH